MSKLKLNFRRKKRQSPSPLSSSPDDFLMAITNNLSGAVIVIDDRQKVLHYNAATLDILNTNADLMQKNAHDILILKDKDGKSFNVESHINRTEIPTTFDDVHFVVDPEEPVRLELRISPIRSNFAGKSKKNPISGYVLFLRDITRAKSLEEERSEFISVVSHELRTPTATVEGTISNLQLMINQPGAVDKKAFASTLNIAHNQIKSLSELINSLSTLSGVERDSGKFTPAPTDLQELLDHLHHEYSSHADQKSLDLSIDTHLSDPILVTHRPYLEEIVRNFLTNALKYTERGRITLRASDTPEGITISVEDTGIGISHADQRRIFDRFYRAENYQTRQTEGIGLGLYISFKLARKLGADLNLDSQLGSGSTFSIILPRTIAPEEK